MVPANDGSLGTQRDVGVIEYFACFRAFSFSGLANFLLCKVDDDGCVVVDGCTRKVLQKL